ncbi:MAG: DegQ family serine endoprotease [Methylocystis sp.]|nr:DegQ family serine endoprotease [Methylocystis sp.]MCA3582110.1 DegQ family serine endoprotease [Methylocystis sp.]MCA3586742.1 DegQ family serine endoprotease [Methylocystis sp.]MCA3590991.1 DegQ family serine endoprotease [Methylocystis sp.]
MNVRTKITAAFCAFLFVAAVPDLCQAQGFFQRQAPETKAQAQLSFAPLVKQAAPAVVNVYAVRREQRPRNSFMDDPFFREFFGGGRQGQNRVQQSVGSGVIVSADGLVMTNHHVIEGMTEVKVALADRREFDADIILRDQRTDLAVLRLKGLGDNKIAFLTLGDSEQLEVGDMVLAIGNPFGVGQTVTSGIVSALARTQVGVSDYQFFIQTDAAINPGNSGGALIDMNGKLIGINTAIFSRSGGSHGIGFAIPANMVRVVIDSARGGGATVRRPWFGARLDSLDREKAEALGLDRPTGALVASVVEKSPAAESGLRRGDVIVAVDNQEIADPDAFGFRYATKGISGQSSLSVLRGGKRIIVPVRLAAAPETRPREPVVIRSRSPFAGLTIMNMSPAVAEELSVDTSSEGVVVAAVEDGSNAQQVGFQKGDVIVSINNERPAVSKDVERLTSQRSYRWIIQISRGGQVFTQQLFGG